MGLHRMSRRIEDTFMELLDSAYGDNNNSSHKHTRPIWPCFQVIASFFLNKLYLGTFHHWLSCSILVPVQFSRAVFRRHQRANYSNKTCYNLKRRSNMAYIYMDFFFSCFFAQNLSTSCKFAISMSQFLYIFSCWFKIWPI